MLRVDLNGFMLHNENRTNVVISPDERPEWMFSRVIAKRLNLKNHLVKIRESDDDVNDRSEFLLEGRRDELSLAIKIGSWDGPAGFYVNLPRNRYSPDLLLSDLLRKYLCLVPGLQDFTGTEYASRAPLLLPPRPIEVERPARAELVIGSVRSADWDYWLSPPTLILYSQCVAKAIHEFDDTVGRLESLEIPARPLVEDQPEEEPSQPKPEKPKLPKPRASVKL